MISFLLFVITNLFESNSLNDLLCTFCLTRNKQMMWATLVCALLSCSTLNTGKQTFFWRSSLLYSFSHGSNCLTVLVRPHNYADAKQIETVSWLRTQNTFIYYYIFFGFLSLFSTGKTFWCNTKNISFLFSLINATFLVQFWFVLRFIYSLNSSMLTDQHPFVTS